MVAQVFHQFISFFCLISNKDCQSCLISKITFGIESFPSHQPPSLLYDAFTRIQPILKMFLAKTFKLTLQLECHMLLNNMLTEAQVNNVYWLLSRFQDIQILKINNQKLPRVLSDWLKTKYVRDLRKSSLDLTSALQGFCLILSHCPF